MRKSKAITLLELLVVMVIIGILSIVVIPNFTGARSAALHARAQNSMAHIAHAAKIWNAENGTAALPYTPTANDINKGGFNGAIGEAATGIDLSGVDADTIWNYTLTPAGVITASFVENGACSVGDNFTYNLNTNSFTDFVCHRP